MSTVLIVAGETSGDIHGANLARALRALDPSLRIVGAGGVHMREAGVEIVVDPTAHATVGLVEAFQSMHRHARHYRLLQSALRTHRPDAAVLIDSPDFNLRFAERVADHGIPVVYYVSPQIWAWRKGRIRTIKRLVRKMIVILEFEEKIYRDAGVDVAFVGHPLLDARKDVDRDAVRRELGAPRTLIGLLPGSRQKQFRSLFPIMRKAAELIAKEVPEARFVVACAPNINPKLALSGAEGQAMGQGPDMVWNRTPDVMAASDLLIVASGTSTLEAAIYGTPMIVTYRLNPVTAYLLGPLVWLNTKDFSMVNIMAGKRIVPEYYQAKAKPELIAKEAVSILRDGRLPEMRRALDEVRRKLGSPGASRRAAEEVLKIVRAPRP